MTISVKEFSQTKKHLKNSEGISYIEFLNTLKPNYIKVWTDIALGYLSLIFCMAFSLYALKITFLPPFIIIFFGAFLVGYSFHYILQFIHEAAHLNIHPSRKWNDRLTNVFISPWVGMNIKRYRILHFKHHSYLGTTLDSEITYFHSLTLTFLLKSFFGIYPLEIIFSYLKGNKNINTENTPQNSFSSQIQFGICLHLLVLMLCWQMGGIGLVLVWLMGIGMFALLFGALRQLLEHRSEFASDDINYGQIDHGEETRMFGDGPIASTFGAAGFNRHLLHHWEPQVSYTNLKELEEFLCDTSLKEEINSKRSTYLTTFYRLFRWKVKKLSPVV